MRNGKMMGMLALGVVGLLAAACASEPVTDFAGGDRSEPGNDNDPSGEGEGSGRDGNTPPVSTAEQAQTGEDDRTPNAPTGSDPTTDGGKPPAGKPPQKEPPPAPAPAPTPRPPTDTTGTSRAAAGQDCCFGGDYFKCPDTKACFGGFDVNACMRACGSNTTCISDCSRKMKSAPPPTDACEPAPKPATVRCS